VVEPFAIAPAIAFWPSLMASNYAEYFRCTSWVCRGIESELSIVRESA
jgi:hypothetical protein